MAPTTNMLSDSYPGTLTVITLPACGMIYRLTPTSSMERTTALQILRVFGTQGLALALLRKRLLAARIAAHPRDEYVIGAELLKEIDDALAEAGQQRSHRYHRGDADHDAQDREAERNLCAHTAPRAMLSVSPALTRNGDVHSARNAATGSSRAALLAGYQPEMMPTALDTQMESTT